MQRSQVMWCMGAYKRERERSERMSKGVVYVFVFVGVLVHLLPARDFE